MQSSVGIDLGKRTLKAVRFVDNKVEERFSGGTDQVGLRRLMAWLRESDLIGIETGSLTKHVVSTIRRELGCQIAVLDARQLPIIYRSLKKTDKEDALKLARLVSRIPIEELPTVYLPNDKEQEYRNILSDYEHSKKLRVKVLNRLYGFYTRTGHTEIKKGTLRSKTIRESNLTKLTGRDNISAQRLMKHLCLIEQDIADLEEDMRNVLTEYHEFSAIAFSIPGVALITTFTLLAYIGDGSRFTSAKQVSSYAGLVPRIDESGDRSIYGRITPGCRPIKRIILQTAWGLIRSHMGGPLKDFYQRISAHTSKKKAAVATGRKIIETFHTLMRKKEVYRAATPEFIDKKMRFYGLL